VHKCIELAKNFIILTLIIHVLASAGKHFKVQPCHVVKARIGRLSFYTIWNAKMNIETFPAKEKGYNSSPV